MEDKYKELQAAYQLLRESNEKLYSSNKAFQIAAEESGSLVFSYDTKEQMILVDERTAKAFQVEPIQTGVPYQMVQRGIISEDTKEEYIRIHEAMINGEKEAHGIVKLLPADGIEAIYELKFRSIFNEDNQPTGIAVGVYRDITERYIKDLQQARYQQIVYSSDRYSFEYDANHDQVMIFLPDGTGEHIEEYRIDHVSTKLKSGILCPDEDIPILLDFLKNGAHKPIQVQIYSLKNGLSRWYALTGTVTKKEDSAHHAFGTIADITDLKEKEISHRKLERVLQSLKNEYLSILELDMEQDTYTILSINPQAFGIGLPSKGNYSLAHDKISDELLADEYRENFREFGSIEFLKKALSKERRVEVEFMTNKEEHIWRRNSYQCVEYRQDLPIKVILYQSDIDQIKAEKLMQQQALQEAYHFAESANAAKTSFLSRMSHDIRTPMNAIIGMTAIATTQIENHDRVLECLGKITIASKHLLSLINEVLDMSKIESGLIELQEEEFNLADLIDNMITMVLPQINQRGHNLNVSIEDLKHEWVIGDSLRIQQAFVNLISNAAKYTPSGGEIKVHIKERTMKSPNYGEYQFIFQDNGIGMTEEFQEILFDPFTRADDSYVSKTTGTGLGMTITRNIIRMMDGNIQVQSTLGHGSCFTVTIHLKLQDRSKETPQELSGLPVLIVDDDQITCESTCIMLEDIGMQAEWCLNGKTAIQMVKEHHANDDDYFVAIIDWKMPEMDGIATARAIRKEVGPNVPIIIISAYDWSEIEADAQAAGVDRFISKPLFKSRLICCFKEFLHFDDRQYAPNAISIDEMCFSDKHLLLVEDNDLNAEIAKEILEMTGAKIHWATDGREAVSIIETSPEGYFDMIFMDIQMPLLNGYEATTTIRSLDRKDVKEIPIIAMTANAFLEDVNQAKRVGMNEHISKPIDMKQLENIMRKYLQ